MFLSKYACVIVLIGIAKTNAALGNTTVGSRNSVADIDVEAADVAMSLNPKKCVAISKGRDCYVDVVLSISLAVPKNVCIFSSQQEQALKCWQNTRNEQLNLSLVSPIDITLSLIDADSKEVIASDVVNITWVYKEERKKRRWRMF